MTESGRVADQLRRFILTGQLAARTALRQEAVAKSMGVSRLPVRDALAILHGEGLVVSTAHEGAVVAPLSRDAAAEAFELRVALEPLALRRTFAGLSNADLGRAEDAVEQGRHALTDLAYAEANWLFHASLYRNERRPFLFATLRSAHLSASRYQIMGASTRLRRAESEREHLDLLAACRARDLATALDILGRHLATASRAALAELDASQSHLGGRNGSPEQHS